jgi:FMN phosphatase YigB (HAD superfamily)
MKTILVDAVYCFVVKDEGKFGIFDQMHDLLEKYPNNKIILTNASDDKFEEYGFHNMPYEVFTLKHNPEKTDPEYFIKLLNHLNLGAKDVVYFEHNIEAVKSAQSVGIISYFYDENKRDLIRLETFLAKNL